MADFETAFNLTMKIEGGYQCMPEDNGNWTGGKKDVGFLIGTKFGISAPVLKAYLGRNPTIDEMKNLSLETAKSIYKKNFWDVNKLDEVKDQKIANEMFDTATNCGELTAAKFLQRALNLSNLNQFSYKNISIDGVIGSQTLSALNNHKHPEEVLKLLNVLQGARYVEICENNETQEKFMRSWLSRVSLNP